MKIREAVEILDIFLAKKSLKRELIICGGAALNLMGISSRETKDIDVIVPTIDEELKKISLEIAECENLAKNWVNNGPRDLINDLEPDWKKSIVKIYQGEALTIYSISREDLIFSKLYAMCDRRQDLGDLLALKVTRAELDEAAKRVKKMDGNPDWPAWVDISVVELLEKIDDE